MDTFKSNNVTYTILKCETVEELAVRLPYLAKEFAAVGVVAQVFAKRPTGTRQYLFHKYASGNYKFITSVR